MTTPVTGTIPGTADLATPGTAGSATPGTADFAAPGTADFAAEWEAWHAEHEARLAGPHGFLAITGLRWLTGEPQRFPDAPGEWLTGPDGVVVTLGEGEELMVGGSPVRGRYSFGVIPERGGVSAVWGEAVIEVARRGGNDIIRPRHPGNALRTAFRGTPAYSPDPRWVITGQYVLFAEPRPTAVGSVVDGLEHVYDAPGQVHVTVEGHQIRLTAFPGHQRAACSCCSPTPLRA